MVSLFWNIAFYIVIIVYEKLQYPKNGGVRKANCCEHGKYFHFTSILWAWLNSCSIKLSPLCFIVNSITLIDGFSGFARGGGGENSREGVSKLQQGSEQSTTGWWAG